MKTISEIQKELKEILTRLNDDFDVSLPDYYLENNEKVDGGEKKQAQFWDVVKRLQGQRHPYYFLADAFGRYIQSYQDFKQSKKDTLEKTLFLIEQIEFYIHLIKKEGNGKVSKEITPDEKPLPANQELPMFDIKPIAKQAEELMKKETYDIPKQYQEEVEALSDGDEEQDDDVVDHVPGGTSRLYWLRQGHTPLEVVEWVHGVITASLDGQRGNEANPGDPDAPLDPVELAASGRLVVDGRAEFL